jgi:hypothetical protein
MDEEREHLLGLIRKVPVTERRTKIEFAQTMKLSSGVARTSMSFVSCRSLGASIYVRYVDATMSAMRERVIDGCARRGSYDLVQRILDDSLGT